MSNQDHSCEQAPRHILDLIEKDEEFQRECFIIRGVRQQQCRCSRAKLNPELIMKEAAIRVFQRKVDQLVRDHPIDVYLALEHLFTLRKEEEQDA